MLSCSGLSIEFMGVTYDNNTAIAIIAITEIGEDDSAAVMCRTDLTTCCTKDQGEKQQGHWLYPNGNEVGNRNSDDDIFRSRGNMTVRLHRMDNIIAPIETGQYCCVVATMANSNTRICITLTESGPVLV